MTITQSEAESMVRSRFATEGVELVDLIVRRYPEETIFVASVAAEVLEQAATVGNRLDHELSAQGLNGFVTVRQTVSLSGHASGKQVSGAHDPRATQLVQLLQSRSRASETQPSLSYVRDSVANITKATTARHHLIFGRRGAGKTALLAEAKAQVESAGDLVVWINLQPHRWSSMERVVASVLRGIADAVQTHYIGLNHAPSVAAEAARLSQELERSLAEEDIPTKYIRQIIPRMQTFIQKFCNSTGLQVFVFLDDFYFIPRQSQVDLLDLIHAAVRDSNAWLKIASIRHLTRWFEPSRQAGLQIGHDADSIDLDVTLQEPTRAKAFLEQVLRAHADKAGVTSITRVFSTSALDRLVLASGSVPRDYLTLAGESILLAQGRTNARLVGVQDVNRAAGAASQIKLQELEEDLNPNSEWAAQTRRAFELVNQFCLDTKRWTYFRVELKDKERHSVEYDDLASLMDLRLIHLLNPALSDEKVAGRRHEVYLLDLSQYSGDRLRKRLHVLDFDGGHLIQKETGLSGSQVVGDTVKRLFSILRRGPEMPLSVLTPAQTPPPRG